VTRASPRPFESDTPAKGGSEAVHTTEEMELVQMKSNMVIKGRCEEYFNLYHPNPMNSKAAAGTV
jgi:hypothetical protein